jgi:hypothetical protein
MNMNMKKVFMLIGIITLNINSCGGFYSPEQVEEYYTDFLKKFESDINTYRETLLKAYPVRTYTTETDYVEDALTSKETEKLAELKSSIATWMNNSNFIKSLVKFSITHEKDFITLCTQYSQLPFLKSSVDTDTFKEKSLELFVSFLESLYAFEKAGFAHLLLEEYSTNKDFSKLLKSYLDSDAEEKYHQRHFFEVSNIEMIYNFLTIRNQVLQENTITHAQG